MSAGNLDLTIEKGSTFRHQFRWTDAEDTPIGLAGYTAKMQIRDTPDSTAVLLELSTENGRIVLNVNPGEIDLEIAATTMAHWLPRSSKSNNG
jgi:hypothetical protein